MTTPRIVVLDGYTLNPGDLSWKELEALGDCSIFDRTPPGEIRARIGDAPIVFTNKTPLNAATLAALPNLRFIGVLATGYNVVDVQEAARRGITVTNIPAYGTAAVAQHTIALLLELTQHVGRHAESVRAGEWARSKDWCYWHSGLIELAGMKLGLIGKGRIAEAVAAIARALQMEVAYATRAGGRAELEKVLRESDVISLHCPLTPDTKELINAETLRLMKPSAFLLNTSRGPLIREADLAAALEQGLIAGAGLDVLSTEPPTADNPLLTARHCLITPHIAWAAGAARKRLMGVAVENLRTFLAGTPQNVVAGPGAKK
jgi:glycerate dehydrogenase